MANLAIKGHATRSKEVIEILEMLGGNNTTYDLDGSDENAYYYIHHDYIDADHKDMIGEPHPEFKHYTLEEFLEKFPYKVGDKVIIEKYYGQIFEILSARWCNERNIIMYQTSNGWYYTNKLQPYKKETMEEIKIDIPKGYKFAGIDDDNQQVVFEKIGCQYPKTYEECCDVLNIDVSRTIEHSADCPFYKDITCYEYDLLSRLTYLRKLIVCIDAYWEIAGEQMGLDKPWKPDWENVYENHYTIVVCRHIIKKGFNEYSNRILIFPTVEIRDAFYENFKDLIEQCKELL